MNLYYNKEFESFSTSQSEGSELLYTAHNTINKLSYSKSTSDGKFKLAFDTKFGSEFYDFIRVKLYVQDTLLLPISLYFSEEKLNYEVKPPYPNDPTRRILYFRYFKDYMGPYTLARDNTNCNWSSVFEQICNILNNFQSWIDNEAQKLIEDFSQRMDRIDSTEKKLSTISNVIQLLRKYNHIEPHVITRSIGLITTLYIPVIKNSLEYVLDLSNSNHSTNMFHFDTIWNYLKDFT